MELFIDYIMIFRRGLESGPPPLNRLSLKITDLHTLHPLNIIKNHFLLTPLTPPGYMTSLMERPLTKDIFLQIFTYIVNYLYSLCITMYFVFKEWL